MSKEEEVDASLADITEKVLQEPFESVVRAK